MNPSNRTIEEKLAIVQQLRSNSNAVSGSKTITNSYKAGSGINIKSSASVESQEEDNSHFLAFLVVRFVICAIFFGIIAFIESKNPAVNQYINAMIITEENGNLIDFMSPFTYTLQENVESAPEADSQESESIDSNAPSEE